MRSKTYIGHYVEMKKVYRECRFFYIIEEKMPKFMYNKRRKWIHGRHRLVEKEIMKALDRELRKL